MRDYNPAVGRYIQSDPIGLASGSLSTYGYVDANPLSFIDVTGLVKHTTGKMIDCGKGCWIRIDFTFDEKTGVKTRHLHWGCKGEEGECGEFGQPSHGGTWDNAPSRIKDCATKNGFQGEAPKFPDDSAQMTVPDIPWWLIILIPFPGNPIYGGL